MFGFKIFGGCLQDFSPLDPSLPSAGAPPPQDRPSAGRFLRRTAQNFALFFLSPAANFILSSLSEGSSRLILVVFLKAGALMCTFGLSGVSCETPAALGPPGLHTTTINVGSMGARKTVAIAMETRTLCRLAIALRQKVANHPPRSPTDVGHEDQERRCQSHVAFASFATNARPSALHSETSPELLALAHAARWWPKTSRERPQQRGRGRRRRRSKRTRKRCASIRFRKLGGVVENATPARGPLCDLNNACSWSAKRGINLPLKWRSMRDAASCCQPCRTPPGSKSSGSLSGRR